MKGRKGPHLINKRVYILKNPWRNSKRDTQLQNLATKALRKVSSI